MLETRAKQRSAGSSAPIIFHCVCSPLLAPWILDNDKCGKQPWAGGKIKAMESEHPDPRSYLLTGDLGTSLLSEPQLPHVRWKTTPLGRGIVREVKLSIMVKTPTQNLLCVLLKTSKKTLDGAQSSSHFLWTSCCYFSGSVFTPCPGKSFQPQFLKYLSALCSLFMLMFSFPGRFHLFLETPIPICS